MNTPCPLVTSVTTLTSLARNCHFASLGETMLPLGADGQRPSHKVKPARRCGCRSAQGKTADFLSITQLLCDIPVAPFALGFGGFRHSWFGRPRCSNNIWYQRTHRHAVKSCDAHRQKHPQFV